MNRPTGRFPGSDDPLALAQDALDDRPRPEAPARSRRSRPAERRQPTAPPPDFPECPPDRGERTWRLVRLFVETGEAYGRTRVVSPWLLGKELAAKINTDSGVRRFIAEYGGTWAEDILSRMIRIYWRDYVDSQTSRTMLVTQYLDDYWSDLFDQAKIQYATDEFQRLDAAGQLKTTPHKGYRSLLNDAEYQDALKEIDVEAKLRQQLVDPLNPEDTKSNPEPHIGKRRASRGGSSRKDA